MGDYRRRFCICGFPLPPDGVPPTAGWTRRHDDAHRAWLDSHEPIPGQVPLLDDEYEPRVDTRWDVDAENRRIRGDD